MEEKMFDLAFALKKAKLWSKLADMEIFAVRFLDGETGYISVMGKEGMYYALGVYIGQDGFESLMGILDDSVPESYFKEIEKTTLQNCLQVSFEEKDMLDDWEIQKVRTYAKEKKIRLTGKNAYPHFETFAPHHIPWNHLSEKELEYIKEAMEAALDMAEKLKKTTPYEMGFLHLGLEEGSIPLMEKNGDSYTCTTTNCPVIREKTYPSGGKCDEFSAAMLRKKKPKMDLECELIYLPTPVQNEPDEVPFFPATLMMVDGQEGYMIPFKMIQDLEKEADKLIADFVKNLKSMNQGVSCFYVRDERTAALIQELADQLRCKVVVTEDLFMLDDALDSFQEHLMEEEGMDDLDFAIRMIEDLENMPEEAYDEIPDEILGGFEAMLDANILPEEYEQKLEAILAKARRY